ncbi:MAG: hypothetical protein GY771_11045 [bacterium]|nr:hypothetical protein [bacterium]
MFLPSLITGLAGTAFSVPIGMWLISSFGALVTDKRDTLRSFVIIFEYMRKTKNGLGILSITFVVSYIILAVGSVIGQLTLLLPQGIIFYVSLVSNIIQTLVSPALYLLAIAFFTALAYEYFIKGESEDGISE